MRPDYLDLHLKDLPYFRALVRANEARFYQEFDLPRPILDVGCGDGHFAGITFSEPLDAGIDPWWGPLRKAVRSRAYRMVVQGSGSQMPFEDGQFASAVSNSVLEHIPDVQSVLDDTARVLAPGAPFLFCVPNHQFLGGLSVSNTLDRIGLRGVGDAYRAFFNRISRHHHCDDPAVWQARLAQAGFELERWWHYIPPQGLAVVEWGHYFGLPSLLIHAVTRRWILAPQAWNLVLARRITGRYYGPQAVTPQGVYTFYVARRTAG